MSPNDIEVLIHHHCTPDAHPRAHASAVQEAIQRFVADGIFETRPDLASGYTTTAKGTAWMEMILATPYPEMRWIDPRVSESAMQARDRTALRVSHRDADAGRGGRDVANG